jgi:hypothetical protein
MNTTRTTWTIRLSSMVLSAFITLSVLGSIDALSQRDLAADSLMAQATQSQAKRS